MPFDIPDNDVAFDTAQSIWMSTDVDVLSVGVSGTGVRDGCDVTAQGSPDMTCAVAAGTIRIASGLYLAVTSGNVTIGTADTTYPRIDLVSASDTAVKTVTAGTPAANPKPPELPSGHVGLAMVFVPANDTTIASNQIIDKRAMLPSHLPWLFSLTVGASATEFVTDTLMPRVGGAVFSDNGDNGIGLIKWYRSGTYNVCVGVAATNGTTFVFRGSTLNGNSGGGFNFYIEANTAGARLGCRNYNSWGRTFYFQSLQGYSVP